MFDNILLLWPFHPDNYFALPRQQGGKGQKVTYSYHSTISNIDHVTFGFLYGGAPNLRFLRWSIHTTSLSPIGNGLKGG